MSRVKGPVLAALAAAFAGAAWAQQDQPIPQTQAAPDQPGAPPIEPPPAPRPPAIEMQQLRGLDAWTVGALSPQQGALPRNMWAHTDPSLLAAALARLPAVYESPAAQVLARRVLLSGADAPDGDASEAARKRFEALGRMGAADDLSMLTTGASEALNDAAIAQFAAQAELARGRRTEACARGRSATGNPPPIFILRLRAFCAAAGGDRAAADLALEIARGNGGDDAWTTTAIGIVGGASAARPPAAKYDNSLSAAISLAARLRPSANPLANASTLALATVARGDTAPAAVRAQAAALAFRRGAISAADARAILAAIPANIATGLPPLATAQRAVTAAPASPQAATAIAGVLRGAPSDFTAAARFFKDDIGALPPETDPARALLFAKAALATGDATLSAHLLQAAHAAAGDANALASLDAALAVLQNIRGASAAMAMQRRIEGASGAAGQRLAARDITLLAAAGYPLDAAAQAFLLAHPPQGGASADAGAIAALNASLARSAPGETALFAAIALADGPARLDAGSLAAIISALRSARLEGDARRVTVEALLAGAPAS